MSATLTVRHTVADYDSWLVAYKDAGAIRDKHGCTAEQVYRLPADGNDIFVTHDFPSAAQAEASPPTPTSRRPWRAAACRRPLGSRSSSLPEPRRSRRPGRAGASQPSPAALGVVRVGDDFTDEYPDGDVSATEAVASLVRTGVAVNIEFDRAMLASHGAPQAVMNCLAVIEGAEAPLTPGQISERTLVSSATMTNTLDALERLGWARRIPNPDDRRSVLVEITSEGEAIADRYLPGIRTLEQALLSELTTNERTTLLKLLGKVLAGTAAVAAAEPIALEGRRVLPERRR